MRFQTRKSMGHNSEIRIFLRVMNDISRVGLFQRFNHSVLRH